MLFAEATDFVDQLRVVEDSPAEARSMAERGRDYVLAEYSWDTVLDRMETSLRGLT
jgi:hypothetical protein